MRPVFTDRARPAAQRGAATLTTTVLLLFATSLALLYLGRAQIFDQRTSANLAHSTTAIEVAEAGIEWATGMLNTPQDVGADCALAATSNVSFRKRYVMTKWNAVPGATSDIAPANNVQPGCRITDQGLSCRCPATAAGTADLNTDVTASFTVRFEAVAGDTEAVRVTSWGCTAMGTACDASTAPDADANARVQVVLKLLPVLRAAPAAALTCGTSCTLGGSANVINTDVPTNGTLVNAGTTIDVGNGVSLNTLAGMPVKNALVANDATLASLASTDADCSNSNMFRAYFGSSLEEFRESPMTTTLSCSSASDCMSRLTTAYNDGARAFYFDSDLHLSGNMTIGSSSDPVSIVTPHAIDLNGTMDIYGIIFSNNADWDALGTGNSTLHGAQVSCAAYKNNGNGTVTYDAEALRNARVYTARMVRVPGSWKDF